MKDHEQEGQPDVIDLDQEPTVYTMAEAKEMFLDWTLGRWTGEGPRPVTKKALAAALGVSGPTISRWADSKTTSTDLIMRVASPAELILARARVFAGLTEKAATGDASAAKEFARLLVEMQDAYNTAKATQGLTQDDDLSQLDESLGIFTGASK